MCYTDFYYLTRITDFFLNKNLGSTNMKICETLDLLRDLLQIGGEGGVSGALPDVA